MQQSSETWNNTRAENETSRSRYEVSQSQRRPLLATTRGLVLMPIWHGVSIVSWMRKRFQPGEVPSRGEGSYTALNNTEQTKPCSISQI